MNDIHQYLINKARENALNKYNTTDIKPVGDKTNWEECFTYEDNMIIFWYDVELPIGNTTNVVIRDLSACDINDIKKEED